MYLARNSNGGVTYSEAYNWPAWKVRSRIKHCAYWIGREEQETEAAMARSRRS